MKDPHSGHRFPSRARGVSSAGLAIAAAGLLLAGSFGCGSLPLEPRSSDAARTPSAPAAGRPVEIAPIGPALPEVVEDIEGAEGGYLQSGRIRVEVPAGAFAGQAQVRLTVPDSTRLLVQLEIDPPEKNHFDAPVTLVFDCRDAADIQHMGVLWYNERLGRWEQVIGDVDPVRRTVSSPLGHFSQYKCEKVWLTKASW